MVEISLKWYDFEKNCWCFEANQGNNTDGILSLGFFNERMGAIEDTNRETHLINYSKNISDRCSNPHIPNLSFHSDYEVNINVNDKINNMCYSLSDCPKEFLTRIEIKPQTTIHDVKFVILDDNYNVVDVEGYDVFMFKHGDKKWQKLDKEGFRLFDVVKGNTNKVVHVGISIMKKAKDNLSENTFRFIGLIFYV